MATYRLSRLARLDLFDIADYTFETWGQDQVHQYLDHLQACFERLAQSPRLGRKCDSIRPGYRRLEHEKHVIFYRIEAQGVFISRILHQRMLPRRHFLDDPKSE